MANNDQYANQRKRKHSEIKPNAASRVPNRYNGSFANTTLGMTELSRANMQVSGRSQLSFQLRMSCLPTSKGAHHFGIESATFNTTNINAHSPAVDPYSILHGAIAIEATQTSKTAEYAPKCHPKTRTQIIADIVEMVKAEEKPIIWLSGPAGGGKTCIMREVADRCQRAGWPTCTYYFSTRVPGLATSTPFVATIAHQLLEAIPPLRSYILNTISIYPTIFQRSLEFQMERLIIEPLRSGQCRSGTSGTPSKVVVVIDGYDECSDENDRQHLLQLLEFLDEKVPQSIVIVVASRPELDIRTSFDNPHLKSITRPVLLHSYNGNSDVLIYFADEFERIRRTHPKRAQIPEGWPVEAIVHTLIDKSSGNFVLPSTIIKYISNLRRNPVEMLEKVLAAFSLPTDENPLVELDALYTLILHPPGTEIPLMKRILHSIMAITEITPDIQLSPTLLDDLLQLPSGTVEGMLCDLHSVVKVPSPDIQSESKTICFHHKSLEDFLLSPGRSTDLFQALYETHLDLALVCSQHLLTWAANPTRDVDREFARAAMAFGLHVSQFLETKPISVVIPDPILEFDTRIIARLMYAFNGIKTPWERPRIMPSRGGAAQAMYEELVNIPDELTEQSSCDYSIALLPHFDIKSGLYDQDEIDGLPYPVGPRLLALRLETIRDAHPLRNLIPDGWPIKDIVNALIREEHSDLLVPSLIVQYLRNPRHNPIVTLERALSALSSIPPSSESSVAQLDAVYTVILHPPEADIPLIKRLLHCMIGMSHSRELYRYHTATRYDRLLDLPAGTSEAALSDIDSVLFLFDEIRNTFHPRSLEDYLLSPDRSKDMFQSVEETHLDITLAKAHLIQKWAELPRSSDQEWNPKPTNTWCFHFEEALGETSSIPAALLQFDLRLVWRYMYCYDTYDIVYGRGVKVLGSSHTIQSRHCTEAACPWCRILNRMKSCAHKVQAICSADEGLPEKDRLENLPQFDMESGLYDDEEIDQLSYPVGRRLLALKSETQAQASPG